ncbi:MAG: hypothetical protein K2Z81_04970, partial [Cyanobacteria bacterium]|nr:hypothetical protein [Cyanobacteriota bacterium]
MGSELFTPQPPSDSGVTAPNWDPDVLGRLNDTTSNSNRDSDASAARAQQGERPVNSVSDNRDTTFNNILRDLVNNPGNNSLRDLINDRINGGGGGKLNPFDGGGGKLNPFDGGG